MGASISVEIRGETFPLCLTVEALEEISDLCGGFAALNGYLYGREPGVEKGEAGKAYANITHILGVMVKEGEENRYMEDRWGNPKAERRLVPGAEELKHLLTPGEALRYRESVILAINEGMSQKIEAAPEKNAGGAGLE